MNNLRRQSVDVQRASARAPGNPAAAQGIPRLWPKRIHRKKYGRWYR